MKNILKFFLFVGFFSLNAYADKTDQFWCNYIDDSSSKNTLNDSRALKVWASLDESLVRKKTIEFIASQYNEMQEVKLSFEQITNCEQNNANISFDRIRHSITLVLGISPTDFAD